MARWLRTLLATGITHAAASDDLNFLVMGDWGGSERSPYTTSSEVALAKGMNTAAEELGAKWALALGDNFYSHGLDSVDSSRFHDTFEQCFSGSNLQSSNGFTFHVVAGNHDHRGNVQAQIDYTQHSERWSFPDFYYTFTKTAPDGATVQVVFIDTVLLFGNSQLTDDEDGPQLHGSELPGPANLSIAESQAQWLDETLAASTADYLIVGGHYPVYSIAEHGPTSAMQPDKFPYFQKHQISAYFCGHEHSEQHIDVGDGIQYHVIGAAHKGDKSTKHKSSIDSSALKFHDTTGGAFASVTVNKQGMTIKHLNPSGSVKYTSPTILPRGSVVV